MSSGERKRIRLNLMRVIPVGGCVWGVVGIVCAGSDGPAGGDKGVCEGNRVEYRAVEGEGPVPVGACPADHVSRVARVPWNPV
ncbi:hypothetical protein BMYO_2169 [Bifidobacterium myosotis]|uniref:Uncharacterized protein n=1 Tax=Bifidobacterium myosotis TaxID=1630166 RepID=A0A261F938_9BIFI|nr:hypothetical protein BMYO_2169 [Bifidobacterium myosotis]